MSNANGPCNCGPGAPGDPIDALAQIPSLEALDAELESAIAEEVLGSTELDLALGASELSPEEELAFASAEDAGGSSADGLVELLQRYPGLKVTLSF